MNRYIFLAMLMALFACSAEKETRVSECALGVDSISNHVTKLTSKEAIGVASAAAKEKGTDLSHFHPPTICFDAKDSSWFVFFNGLDALPGHHFSVTVYDNTSIAKIMPGI